MRIHHYYVSLTHFSNIQSVACYRTGLDITKPDFKDVEDQLNAIQTSLKATDSLRLAHKPLNDFIVRMVLEIAGRFKKPGMSLSH